MNEIKKTDAVLIDDDTLVHLVWRMSASQKGKNVLVFSRVEEFENNSFDLDVNVPIYLDSQLGEEGLGEDLAERLQAKGFTNIFLCTGFSKDMIKNHQLIQGVVGKEPPWETV